MANERFGALGDVARAVQRFVIEGLEAEALRLESPRTINIDLAFADFLRQHGVNSLVAEDVVVEQRVLVRRRVTEQIERWRGQGVLSPLGLTVESDEIIVTWRHARFAELTGSDGPAEPFVRIYEWLGNQNNRGFLLPCMAFLKILGCDPIFVTDGARDEGIDCIGLIASGGLKSTAIFIQARSKADLFVSDHLLQEYAKYCALPRTSKYLTYLEALGLLKMQDGMGYLYAVLTNSDFKFSAQQYAARLGVLLRSRRQLAQFLATGLSLETLERWKAQIAIPPGADLTTNVAPLMTGVAGA
jgi:hypothetical protein